MAQKIQWQEPSENTITQVEINRSTSIYGSYTVINTINATSDGNVKSSSNTWIVTFTDASGLRTHWYKIRFYDSATSLWSEFSEPITAEELLRLCTVEDVKLQIDTVGRWTDDEIFDQITEVDDLIYIEMGTPLQAIYSDVETYDEAIQKRYYVGEENIYRIDRVFYGTTNTVELYLDDEFKANNKRGMIEVLPYASSGIELSTQGYVEVHFVPQIYHKLSLFRTCKSLLELVDLTSSGKTSKELEVMINKLKTVETILMNRNVLQLSSDVTYYDSYYGVNKKKLKQQFGRNKFVGSTGW